MRPKRPLQALLAVTILIGFLVAVESYIGWGALLVPWSELTIGPMLVAAGLVLLSYVIRALRLYDYFLPLTRGRVPSCIKLMMLHNLLNNLLPMRTGEASFPLIMDRYFAVPLPQSLAALLWFRLLDLHTLSVLALASLGSQWFDRNLVIALCTGWLTLPWWLVQARQLSLVKPLRRRRWLVPWQAGLPQTPRMFWGSWAWTWVNWTVKLAVFAWILRLFAQVPPNVAWFAAIGGELTSVLPVHGVAGAGTYEAGVVAAMLPFGIPTQTALQAAVNLHLFLLGISLGGAGLSLLIRHAPAPRQ